MFKISIKILPTSESICLSLNSLYKLQSVSDKLNFLSMHRGYYMPR